MSVDPIMSQHAKRVGRQGVVPDWKTSEAGIEWRLLPDDATPGKTAVSRLLQMRRLAEKFSAQITSSDVEKASDLRLLIQPLYRYSSAATGVVDGGLFSFVLATDPELLLMVELRETKDGSRWHYAAARFTNRPLKLMHGNLEVWSCAKAEAYVGHQPYFLYWGVGRRSSAFDR
ncbi:MAG: hypothetical protein JSS49_06675 [Planctomycetes bacterium]|nr:hypothetical protein [Planctomycetota bacterium]